MNYFHDIGDINAIEESDLDNIKCISKFNINKEILHFLWETVRYTITNRSILCRTEDVVKEFKYSGELPSKLDVANNLESSDIETSWENRIKYEIFDDEYTLLSIRSNKDKDKNMKFVNGGDVLRFDHVLEGRVTVKFNENYLIIVINNRNYKQRKNKNPVEIILIKVIVKNNEENVLIEILRTNLCERFPSCDNNITDIRFDMNMISNVPSKLLIVWGSMGETFLVTFNINTLQFSTLFKLNVQFAAPFYCYHNILKEVIIILDTSNFIVYVIKETAENSFYIYKQSAPKISGVTDMFGATCCCNRNNEIILFFTAEKDFHWRFDNIFIYDVLNDEMHNNLFRHLEFENYATLVFFNRTCEELFLADVNHLSIYGYKSKVRSLKKTCQMLVSLQYTSEQLKQMNLPKFILS